MSIATDAPTTIDLEVVLAMEHSESEPVITDAFRAGVAPGVTNARKPIADTYAAKITTAKRATRRIPCAWMSPRRLLVSVKVCWYLTIS
jgi:hypothetical protein